jgi:beta-lactamase superfamily II metal-dependent hydrolase
MLRIEMLNAKHGDALLIEYGVENETHRILIDGGPHHAYSGPGGLFDRLKDLSDDRKNFELLVMTHIDTDHIDGIIRLIQEKALGLTFKDVWFNGWKHVNLAVEGKLGGKQGEFLGALLESEGLPWNVNEAWEPTLGAVVVPDQGNLPIAKLAGSATATLLSPGPGELRDLKKEWVKAVRAADFDPGDTRTALEKLKERADLRPLMDEGTLGTKKDTSEANASSIAFVFEYDGKRLLVTGDAFASVLERSGERYVQEHGELDVAAFKLPHHGSWSNLSQKLVEMVHTSTYLVSTNGGQGYNHPDADAIELILGHGLDAPHFVFNYDQPFTEPWLDPVTQQQEGYTAERSNVYLIAD